MSETPPEEIPDDTTILEKLRVKHNTPKNKLKPEDVAAFWDSLSEIEKENYRNTSL